jgi:hypothetical protein
MTVLSSAMARSNRLDHNSPQDAVTRLTLVSLGFHYFAPFLSDFRPVSEGGAIGQFHNLMKRTPQ